MFPLFGRKRPGPVVPLAALFPARDVGLGGVVEAVQLEQAARLMHTAVLVEQALLAESRKPREMRNGDLIGVLLDVRSAVCPSPPDAEVLRELSLPLPVRYAVPVIPGRAA